MNCILLSDVVTVLHVYTQVRIVIALAALTSVKKRIKAEEEEENLLDSYSTPAKVRDLLRCFLL